MKNFYLLALSLSLFPYSSYAMQNAEVEEYNRAVRMQETKEKAEKELENLKRKILENLKSAKPAGSRMNSKGQLPRAYYRNDRISKGIVFECVIK